MARSKTIAFWLLLGLFLGLASFKLFRDSLDGLWHFPSRPETLATADGLVETMYSTLFDYGLRVEWFAGVGNQRTVRVPKDLLLIEPYVELVQVFQEQGAALLRAESNPDGNRMLIEVGHEGTPVFSVTLVRDESITRTAGQIAIVIDDLGNAFNSEVRGFLALEQPLSYSILPGLRYSERTDRAAAELDRDVLLHMPMEPTNGTRGADEFMLLTDMRAGEIRKRFRKARASVPQARGLNNHMGSRATVDEKLLSILMDEIKRADFYFLDSHTAAETKAYSLARQKKIPCAINGTFLDSTREGPYITAKLTRVAELAVANGHAIGIGHPYSETLEVLQREVPKLEKRGFTFVGISELVQ